MVELADEKRKPEARVEITREGDKWGKKKIVYFLVTKFIHASQELE